MLKEPEIILAVAMSVETRGLQHILEDRQTLQGAGLRGAGGSIAGTSTWIVETGVGPRPAREMTEKVVFDRCATITSEAKAWEERSRAAVRGGRRGAGRVAQVVCAGGVT